MAKSFKPGHTASTQKGSGDFYGTAIRNPSGKPREIMGIKPISKGKMGKPPKSLA